MHHLKTTFCCFLGWSRLNVSPFLSDCKLVMQFCIRKCIRECQGETASLLPIQKGKEQAMGKLKFSLCSKKIPGWPVGPSLLPCPRLMRWSVNVMQFWGAWSNTLFLFSKQEGTYLTLSLLKTSLMYVYIWSFLIMRWDMLPISPTILKRTEHYLTNSFNMAILRSWSLLHYIIFTQDISRQCHFTFPKCKLQD